MALRPYTGDFEPLSNDSPKKLKPFSGEIEPLESAGTAKPHESSAARRVVGDTAVSALKGAVSVPEAAVGLADLATGGRAGKMAEQAGFRPKEAKAMLDDLYSPEQKAANAKVQAAEGFVGTLKAAVENPSVIAHTAIESLPSMGMGGVVGRGAGAAVKALSPVARGAIGEGVVGAGIAAEGIRQQTDDGLLTGKQAGLAATSGVATGAIGALGGKIAQKLGIADIDTALAGGAPVEVKKGLARRVLEGAIAEGVFEELPQSMQEQALQNLALGRPIEEGVAESGALGMLVGGVMGGGMNLSSGRSAPATDGTNPAADPAADPGAGPTDPGINPADEAAATAQARLDQLAAEEAGLPDVPQTAPPDGHAIIQGWQEAERRALDEEMARNRAVASPDDEIHQSTGRQPLPSEQMGIDPAAGPMSAAAALAVDSGASGALQERNRLRAELDAAEPAGDQTPVKEEPRAAAEEPLSAPWFDQETRPVAAQENLTAPAVEPPDHWAAMSADERRGALLATGRWTTKNGDLSVVGKRMVNADWNGLNQEAQTLIAPALQATNQQEFDNAEQFQLVAGAPEQAPNQEMQAQPVVAGVDPQTAGGLNDGAGNVDGAVPAVAAPGATLPGAELGRSDADVQPQPDVGRDGGLDAVAGVVVEGGGSGASTGAPAGGRAAVGTVDLQPTPAKPASDKQANAIARVKAGKATFFSEAKARDFVASNALGDTHEVVQQNRAFHVRERVAPIARTTPAPAEQSASPAADAAQPAESVGLDRAMTLLLDKTDGNGDPSGINGPENLQARTEIVSALTGRPVADLAADPRHKLITSVLQVEKLLHEAVGIKDADLRDRRAAFVEWLDAREGVAQPQGLQVDDTLDAGEDFIHNETDSDASDVAESADPVVRQAEVDPHEFVAAPDGSTDFGEITPEMAQAMLRQAGKIRLQHGVQNADGTGWGLAHIEARHGREIRSAGFESVAAFVSDAVRHVDAVWKPGATSQVVAVQAGNKGKVVFLELQPSKDDAGDFYRVNSAFPATSNYAERKQRKEGWIRLWSRYPVSADTSGAPGFADQSPDAGETAPTVSPQSGSSVAQTEPKTKASEIADFGEKDRGVALFRLGEGVDLRPMGFGAVSAVVDRVVAANQKNWNVDVRTVPTFDALPDGVKEAVAKYGKDEKPKGVLHQGRVYVVADMHTSEADVEATILHEIEGHVGVHRLYGKDINTRLNLLYLAIGGRKGLGEIVRSRGISSLGAYAEALGQSEFTDDVRVQIMMDEALAHIAESPKFGDRVKAIIGAIRQWLRDHGLAALAEYGETDLLHILAQGRKQLKTVKADAGQTVLMFSRGRSMAQAGTDTAFAQDVLAELAEHDEFFRYPVSKRTDLEGVMQEIMPGAKYLGEDTRPDERKESKADRRFAFRSPHGKNFYVFERGAREVWIDVSRLAEGDRGSAIYAAVANYAHNNGKVFVGDPNGLSEAAVMRRTVAMISSALRFGTTEHIEPAAEQLAGIPEKGVPALAWRGNDVDKVGALIETFLATLKNKFPGLENYSYDFRGNRFVDRRGRPVDAARLEHGQRTPDARASRAGQATMRQGILLQSLVSSESGERSGILERFLRGSAQLVSRGSPLNRLFSFAGQNAKTADSFALDAAKSRFTRESLRRAVAKQFPSLSAAVDRMLARGDEGKAGGLVLIDSGNELDIAETFASKTGRALDDAVQMFSGTDGVQGIYDPRSGVTFMILPHVTEETSAGVLLHEMVHGQQRKNVDAQAMAMLMNRGSEKDADTRAFLDRVAQRMLDADAATDSREAAAYIVEQAVIEGRSRGYRMADSKFFAWADAALGAKVGEFLRRVAAMVRTWMIRHGGIKALTVDDLVGYAMVGVERAARGDVRTSARRGRMQSMSDRSRVASEQAPDPAGDGTTGGAKSSRPSNVATSDYAAAERAVADIESLAEQHGKVYIRWAAGADFDLATGALSRDYVSGETHNGLSAVEITADTHPADIARALSEYMFLRMKDGAIKPRVYLGERIGTDSDAHALIKPSKLLYSPGDAVVRAIDRDFATIFDLRDGVASDQVRLARITNPSGRDIVQRAMNDKQAKLDALISKHGIAFQNEPRAPAGSGVQFSRADTSTLQGIGQRIAGMSPPRTTDAFPELNADQRAFLNKVGTPPAQVRASEWVKARFERIGTKIRQGLVDRYAALKEMDEKLHGKDFIDTAITDSAWVLARMSSAASGAMSAMMTGGRVELDGAQRVVKMKEGDASGGLMAVLQKLGAPAEVERFFAWVAANRAEKLMTEGREHLFTADEIAAGKALNAGKTEGGAVRPMLYAQVFREFQQYRDDVLAIAEQTGIISAENRAMWRDEFYVPFYRVMEDDVAAGPHASKGLSRQEAYKKLKGGRENLNDLLENTLMNFHHLLSASMKNQAAAQTVKNAENLGIARVVPESRRDPKNSTFVLANGERVFYEIDDPMVFEALTALSDGGLNNFAVRAMSAFKRMFTNMTTVTPQFIIANTLRDLMQATATTPTSKNLARNLVQGAGAYRDPRTRAEMLASGGAFSFGHIYGADVNEVKANLRRAVRGAELVSSPKMIPAILKKGWDAWGKVADASENVSRAATYVQNVEEKGRLRAAFEARDIMDFSSHGAWPAIRFLIRVVPFLNARLQGLDKIYRAGMKPAMMVAMGKGSKSDKQAAARFWTVTGALTLATIALYMANADDDEYRKLEDWQKDTYWFFRIGDNAFFLPKPFEVGAIATMAERTAEQFMDDKAAGKLFVERMKEMFLQTFAFNPVPQMFQPAIDIYSNKDAFTGRDIESAGMERLSPGLRARASTTAAGKAISAASRMFGDDSMVALSPVQADHLIRGYFGSVGATAAGMMDTFWRAANGEEAPDRRWSEYQPIRRFYRDLGAPVPYTRYSTLFYEGLRESARVYADVKELQALGRPEEARDLVAKNHRLLAVRQELNRQQRRLTEINNRITQIHRADRDGAWKRRELDRLNAIKSAITERYGKRIEEIRTA